MSSLKLFVIQINQSKNVPTVRFDAEINSLSVSFLWWTIIKQNVCFHKIVLRPRVKITIDDEVDVVVLVY